MKLTYRDEWTLPPMKRTIFNKRKMIRTQFPEKEIQISDNFTMYKYLPAFKNCIPGSKHKIIPSYFIMMWPEKVREGVWIMGAEMQPVKLRADEFKIVSK